MPLNFRHPDPSRGGDAVFSDGSFVRFTPGGIFAVPDQFILEAIRLGFTQAEPAPVVPTAGRPTANLVAGMALFDSTLGKPIWRNAANSGWVDATGAAV